MNATAVRRLPRLARHVALVPMLAMLIVGCGDDSDESGEATSAATRGEPTTVKGVSSTNSFSAGPLLYIDVNGGSSPGSDTKQEWRYVLNNPAVMAALLSDETEVAAVGCQGVLDTNLQGSSLEVIAALTTASQELVISKKAADASGVTAESPVQDRLKALEGLRLASSPAGTTTNAFLTAMVKLAGLTPKENVSILPAADPATMGAGIQRGKYDGALYGAGAFTNLVDDGTAVLWVRSQEIPELRDVPTFCAVAKSEWIDEHPDGARAVTAAVADAIAAMKDDKQRSPEIQKKFFGKLPQPLYEATWDVSVAAYPDGAKVTEDGFERLKVIQSGITEKDYDRVTFESAVYPDARG